LLSRTANSTKWVFFPNDLFCAGVLASH
jgi:hypothetical protein